MKPLRIAIAGLGTVGSGVARIVLGQSELLERRSGRVIELQKAIVRDMAKSRTTELSGITLTTSLDDLWTDDVDVVLELIGGTTTAKDVVIQSLKHGKDVITANKALLCEHGDEVFSVAREQGRIVCFEAAVAGGVPVIEAVSQSLASNQITVIEGILNGTCNYILTEMLEKGRSYNDAVKLAQDKGYAEADPSMDVEGTDAAQKLTILTQLAFGTKVPTSAFITQGINTLELADLKYADSLGYRVKLLATAKLKDGKLEMHTQPTLIRRERPMADVYDAYNMIEIEGDAVGRTWFSGMGAGQMPTASAVVSDVISVAMGRAQLTFPRLDLWKSQPSLDILPAEEIRRRYYLRFNAVDRPHTMADITDILGRHDISIASCIQHETNDERDGEPLVPLVIMTHETLEGNMSAADGELRDLESVSPPHIRLPLRA